MGVLGVDRHDAIMTLDGARGPQILSDDQLRFECNAVLKKSQGTRDQLLKDLFNLSACANKMGENEYIASDGRTIPIDGKKRMGVELSATCTIDGDQMLLVHPQTGPVVVPIEIKGVSILAYLSLNSFVTVVPISVVKTFGLRTKPMASDKFISPIGRTISVSAVVDELKFHLGSIEVCLNNAVVVKNEVEGMMDGILLGRDFFASAAWVRCSTRLQDKTFVITDGGYTDNLFLPDQADELRYYSRDGKTCRLPFVHIANLATSEMFFLLTIDDDMLKTVFGECEWCCRCFPSDGMLKCERGGKSHFYCDEECKSQGDEIRALLGR